MTFGYRTAHIRIEFDHEDIHFVATVESCRSMFIAHITAPFIGNTELVQIPMICLQATKTGLVNADYSGLSDFGERTARKTILELYQRRKKKSNKSISA